MYRNISGAEGLWADKRTFGAILGGDTGLSNGVRVAVQCRTPHQLLRFVTPYWLLRKITRSDRNPALGVQSVMVRRISKYSTGILTGSPQTPLSEQSPLLPNRSLVGESCTVPNYRGSHPPLAPAPTIQKWPPPQKAGQFPCIINDIRMQYAVCRTIHHLSSINHGI